MLEDGNVDEKVEAKIERVVGGDSESGYLEIFVYIGSGDEDSRGHLMRGMDNA